MIYDKLKVSTVVSRPIDSHEVYLVDGTTDTVDEGDVDVTVNAIGTVEVDDKTGYPQVIRMDCDIEPTPTEEDFIDDLLCAKAVEKWKLDQVHAQLAANEMAELISRIGKQLLAELKAGKMPAGNDVERFERALEGREQILKEVA